MSGQFGLTVTLSKQTAERVQHRLQAHLSRWRWPSAKLHMDKGLAKFPITDFLAATSVGKTTEGRTHS